MANKNEFNAYSVINKLNNKSLGSFQDPLKRFQSKALKRDLISPTDKPRRIKFIDMPMVLSRLYSDGMSVEKTSQILSVDKLAQYTCIEISDILLIKENAEALQLFFNEKKTQKIVTPPFYPREEKQKKDLEKILHFFNTKKFAIKPMLPGLTQQLKANENHAGRVILKCSIEAKNRCALFSGMNIPPGRIRLTFYLRIEDTNKVLNKKVAEDYWLEAINHNNKYTNFRYVNTQSAWQKDLPDYGALAIEVLEETEELPLDKQSYAVRYALTILLIRYYQEIQGV